MVRSSFIAFCLIVSVFVGVAQEEQTIRLGVICSPVLSWARTDASSIEPSGYRFGINAGLMVDKFFAKNYAVATGISIHTMGGELKYEKEHTIYTNDTTEKVKAKGSVLYKLQYIDIPIGLKMRTTQIGYVTIFAQLGFNFMFNIKENAEINNLNTSSKSVVLNEVVKPFYMGYNAMLGIEYKIVGNTALVFGVNYMNGFTDVIKKDGLNDLFHNAELRLGLVF